MEILSVKNLSFVYPGQNKSALDNLTFSIDKGQFVAVFGASGSGKSTLLRQFKTALTPNGLVTGEVFFNGNPVKKLGLREQSSKIGFVLQSPESQIVTDKVWHELAFGLESLGLETSIIRTRVAEIASFFGIENWFLKNVSELSGGQKQILNLASVMAMNPEVLILDEPTSRLDPIAAGEFVSHLGKINRELGTTVIISEHNLEDIFPLCDSVIIMDKGKIVCKGPPRETGERLKSIGHPMFMAMPVPMRVYAAVPNSLMCPITVRDGREWLIKYASLHKISGITEENTASSCKEVALRLKSVWFRYDKKQPDVLKGLSIRIYKGDFLAIIGGNGAGKSTLLSIIAGALMPFRGRVELMASVAMLPQNPQALFVKKTVAEELCEINSKNDQNFAKRLVDITHLCRLEELLGQHPFDLSGGEMQRLALAKVLLTEPEILLLDEPTKGMDAEFKSAFAAILLSLTERGITVIMVSHDLEFCAEYAKRCAFLFNGIITSEGTPRKLFSENSFYTTSASRMARHLLPSAVTSSDIISACGGQTPQVNYESYIHLANDKLPKRFAEEKTTAPQILGLTKKQSLTKRTIFALIMILIAVPITIFCGIYYLGDRKYTFISLLVLFEAMFPFFLIFENRKPQARELVIISVLCALGVAGRTAFIMLPHFKPVAAIVILSAVAFGGETGFLVGAVTMLASNIIFGQGPWTPWQMFSMGIIGFIAGVLSEKHILPKRSIPLSVFGFISTFVIYGGIMNSANVLMYQALPTKSMFLASYASGVPFDLIHALATFIFMVIMTKPMLEKLERVKTKYGLIK